MALTVAVSSCDRVEWSPSVAVRYEALILEDYIQLDDGSSLHGTDTYIAEGAGTFDTNYGGAQTMLVDGTPGARREAIIRFEASSIQALVPPGSIVLSAELQVRGGGTGEYTVARASPANWTEMGATWGCAHDTNLESGSANCSPNWGAPRAVSPALSTGQSGTVTSGRAFDVTADVQAVVNGGSHSGWFILPATTTSVGAFEARNSGTKGPRLVVRYGPATFAPEEPATTGALAPPSLDRSAPTHVYDAMRWLLEPSRGLQWGFTPGVFEVDRAAVIRGTVVDRNAGNPLAGVEVSVLGHPEFGRTRTRVGTGVYELLVNGGETYTFVFSSETHLAAQRQLTLPWNAWQPLPDIALMLRSDLAGGTISGATGGFVIGPTVSDARGDNRSLRLYVPAGTRVQYVDGAGAVQTSNNFEVRLGEYTTTPDPGVDPLAAMPAELPPTTSYTYAAEGEVLVGGVRRSSPRFQTTAGVDRNVFMYVRIDDGFLTGTGFTPGSPVPYGSYDGARGGWSAENNGVIIGVSTATGSGCVTGAAVGEAALLCADKVNFPAGTYMRVPISHFSFVDLNWLIGLFQDLPESDVDEGDPERRGTAPAYRERDHRRRRAPLHLRRHAGHDPRSAGGDLRSRDAFTDIIWDTDQIRIRAPGSVTTTIHRSPPTGYVDRVCSGMMTAAECASPPGHGDTKPYWELTFGALFFPGLLTSLIDARGGTHGFGYEVTGGPTVASGRLISDSDIGAVTTLSPPVTTSDGWRRVTVTRPADAGTGVVARDVSYDTPTQAPACSSGGSAAGAARPSARARWPAFPPMGARRRSATGTGGRPRRRLRQIRGRPSARMRPTPQSPYR